MDLNDPRRRLQVLNQSNPSLRESVSPQPQLRVQTAAPQQLTIQTGDQNTGASPAITINRDPNARTAAPTPTGLIKDPSVEDLGLNFLKSAGHVVSEPFHPFAAGLARLLPGGQNDIKANESALASNDANMKVYSDLYKSGKITHEQYGKYLQSVGAGYQDVSRESQRIADTADRSQVLGSAAQVAAMPFLGAAEAGATSLAGRIGLNAAEGAGLGLATEFSNNADPTLKGAAINTGLGATVGGMLPFVGNKIKGLFSKGGSKVVNTIANESNPEVIKQTLGVTDDVASFLASETDKGTIEAVIKQLQVDPSLSVPQATQDRLQKDGITQIQKGDTPYGAEYDGNGVIKVRDQANASDAALYHELGHHIYQTKLTSEEKALFANVHGEARQQAEAQGRTGYDLASEDFSDYVRKAIEGNLDQIPAELRPVIQKYTGAVQKEVNAAQDQALRMTPAGHNAKDVVQQPGVADAIVRAADPNNPDALTTVVNAIAKSPNKGDIRQLIEGLKLPVEGNTKNRLVKDLTGETDPAKVTARLNQEIDNYYKTPAQSAEAAVTAAAPNPTLPAEDMAAIKEAGGTINGTTPTEIAPNGAKVSKTEVPPVASAGDVAAPINAAADTAATASAPATTATSPAHEELLGKLDEATLQYKKDAKTYSQQLGQKFAAGTQANADAGGGLSGYKASLSAMKGKKQSGFQPMQVSDDTATGLLDHVDTLKLAPAQTLNTKTAILKVIGHAEGAPTPSDVELIRTAFGNDMADAVTQNVVTTGQESLLQQAAGAPRTMMTIGDFSVPRQAGVGMAAHPIEGAKAFGKGIVFAFKKDRFVAATKAMAKETDQNGDNYSEFMTKDMNLHLPSLSEATQEEAMSAAPLLSRIPVLGKVVDGSNRSFSGTLGELRYNIVKNWIDAAGGIAAVRRDFSPQEMKDMGEAIDTMTGRGGKQGGLVDKHQATLSKTLFSGRLWASRLNLLNPYYYYRLSPPAQAEALKASAAFATLAGSVLELADHMPGTDVGWNPLSADFAKIKVGNTRFDILGGLQQNIRVGAQVISGEKIDSMTGETKKTTAGDVLGKFAEGKVNPLLGYAMKVANDTNDGGYKDINKVTEAAKLLVPLGISGAAQTAQDTGSVAKGAAMNIPGIFGAGVMTYGATPTKDQGKVTDGKLMFKGKVDDTMVKGLDGQVLLNDKGRPIKVTYPKDATTLEKQAIMDEKRHSALSDAYKRTLSKEDQALFKLSDEKLKQYVTDGKIDQARYDTIQNYQKTAESQGKENNYTVPDGIKSPQATAFYQKYNSMNKKDQEAWLKQPADDNAKSVAGEVNKMRSEGLSEFKPSNALTKAYSEYEKDINSHPEYTEVDKRNKAKAFQVFSAKLNYNNKTTDIYNEGGDGDLKTLMEQGQIGKDDLNSAIKLDNELYASGLTGTLKFSKKFREAYGVDMPVGKDGATLGGGSGSGTKSTFHGGHLVLPALTLNPANQKLPEISQKTRGIKFAAPTIAKSNGNSKKISIRL